MVQKRRDSSSEKRIYELQTTQRLGNLSKQTLEGT